MLLLATEVTPDVSPDPSGFGIVWKMAEQNGQMAMTIVFLTSICYVIVRHIIFPFMEKAKVNLIEPLSSLEDKKNAGHERELERSRIAENTTKIQLEIAKVQERTADKYAKIHSVAQGEI